MGLRIVGLGRLGHRLLPAIVARQVAAVPLGADRVQLAQHALANQLHRVVIQNVVVTLVTGGQEQLALLGHPRHLLALVDAVAHQLFGNHVQAGLHGGNGRGGVQVQRQGDDHRLDAVLLGVGDQFLVRP